MTALAAWLLTAVTSTDLAANIWLILEKGCKGCCGGSLECAICLPLCDAAVAVTCADGGLGMCRAAAQEALEAYPGGMQLGGGVTHENAASWLDAGASHVIVTSYVFQDGRLQQDRLQQLVRSCASCVLGQAW